MTARGSWAAFFRSSRVRVALCIMLTLAVCGLLIAAHRQAGPFSQAITVQPGGAEHGAGASVFRSCGTVDVNTATAEELLSLSGVGPVLAEAIVAEREARGPFDYPEDLMMVRGVGLKTLAKFAAQLDFASRAGAP